MKKQNCSFSENMNGNNDNIQPNLNPAVTIGL